MLAILEIWNYFQPIIQIFKHSISSKGFILIPVSIIILVVPESRYGWGYVVIHMQIKPKL